MAKLNYSITIDVKQLNKVIEDAFLNVFYDFSDLESILNINNISWQ